MINMNDMMNQILKEANNDREDEVGAIAKEIVDKTKFIKDCIILDKEGILDSDNINFDRILKMVGDKTGYEVSCNELRFSKEEMPVSQLLYFVKSLDLLLSQKYNERRFGIIVSVYEEEIDLRFHTYREQEGLWLDENLNKYNNPILYQV